MSHTERYLWRDRADRILGENLRYLREESGLDRTMIATEPPVDPDVEVLVENDKVALVSPGAPSVPVIPGYPRNLDQAARHIQNYRDQLDSIPDAQLVLAGGIHWGLAPFLLQQWQRNSDAVVVFVERDLEQLQVAFRLYDLCEALQCQHFFWCVGERFRDRLLKTFRRESLYLIPERRIRPLATPAVVRPFNKEHREGVSAVFSAVSQDQQRVTKSFSRPVDPNASGSLTIWTPLYEGSLHEPIVRAIAGGFQANGNEVKIAATNSSRTMPLRFISGIAETRPNVLFLLNLPGRDFVNGLGIPSEGPLLRSLRCVTWYSDDPAFYSNVKSGSFNERGHVYWMERTWGSLLGPIAPERSGFLPVAGSVPREGEDIERFRHPVTFVGSILDTRPAVEALSRPDRDSVMKQVERLLAGESESLLDSAREIELTGAGVDTVERSVGSIRQQPLHGLPAIAYFLYTVANAEKRIRFLSPLVPLGLHVYGTTAWGKLLPGIPHDHVHGSVGGEEIIDLYRSTLVNIGIHSYQCPTALSQRDFNVLLSGGCLVGDWVADCELGLIEPDTHAVFVRDAQSLTDTVQELIEDESKRREKAEAGKRHVAEHHTYEKRTQEILRRLES